jgi:hypothetical protein
MGAILDIIIITGLGSLAVLWVIVVVMTLQAVWNACGYQVLGFIQKLRDKI